MSVEISPKMYGRPYKKPLYCWRSTPRMCTYTRAHAQNGNRHFCHFFKLSPQSIFAAKNVHGVLTIHRRRSFGSSQRPNVDGHLVSVWLSHFSFRLVHPDSPSSPLPPTVLFCRGSPGDPVGRYACVLRHQGTSVPGIISSFSRCWPTPRCWRCR